MRYLRLYSHTERERETAREKKTEERKKGDLHVFKWKKYIFSFSSENFTTLLLTYNEKKYLYITQPCQQRNESEGCAMI